MMELVTEESEVLWDALEPATGKAAIEIMGENRFFLSSGCVMGRKTPPENMKALVNAAVKFGQFD